MIKSLTILHKGLILIAVPLLFQFAFIGLVAKMRSDGTEAVRWTVHSKEVIAQAEKCRARLLSSHGAVQGLILTRDPAFENALRNSVATTPAAIVELQRLVTDREDQSLEASKIARMADEFLGFMRAGQAMVEAGRMEIGTAATRRVHSQKMLDALEREFDKFLTVEEGLASERQAKLAAYRATMDSVLMGGIAMSTLFTVAVAVLFSRNISSRVSILTENAQRLAAAKELAPPIAGGDEVAALDRVFRQMASTLAEAASREQIHAQILERRAEELDAVNAQLREKAQENEMFVYSVSHDLRSPLVNLQGFSKELELIGRDLSRLVDRKDIPVDVRLQAQQMISSEMAESIGFIQLAVTRLSNIIDALLRLSRAGQVEYRRQPVDVASIVSRVVATLRGTIEERGATVEIGELLVAQGDPTAIEQVFANLIGNAVNYLDTRRSGKIEIFSIDPEKLAQPFDGIVPGFVIHAVRDNGLGIAETYKSKVFKVFQRLHGEVAKGEGVGLALVRRMVERHGGRVWFESVVGEGTTFFVALPGADSPEVESMENCRDAMDTVAT